MKWQPIIVFVVSVVIVLLFPSGVFAQWTSCPKWVFYPGIGYGCEKEESPGTYTCSQTSWCCGCGQAQGERICAGQSEGVTACLANSHPSCACDGRCPVGQRWKTCATGSDTCTYGNVRVCTYVDCPRWVETKAAVPCINTSVYVCDKWEYKCRDECTNPPTCTWKKKVCGNECATSHYETKCIGGSPAEGYWVNGRCEVPGSCHDENQCVSGSNTCQGGCVPAGVSLPGAPAFSSEPPPPSCDPNRWGSYGLCSGSPATRTRTNDCGTTQSASCTGTIKARAVAITPGASCAAVRASTSGITGTVHQFTAGSASHPAAQTQTGADYVTFPNVVGGFYTTSPTVPPGYVLATACWSKAVNSPTSGTGMGEYLSVPQDGDTLTWDMGYTLGTPWVQTGGGGNVYAAGAITSPIAELATPRSFSLESTGGSPGVVTYGGSYDFDPDPRRRGEGYVSSTNWLVNEAYNSVNWYEWLWIKLGGPITPSTLAEMGSPQELMSKPPSRLTPYYVVGDMTTSGNWVVGEGETIIFLITGNLTLDGNVTITGSGFAAFIVKGNITVSSSVGGLYTSSTPVIEGIYVTSPTGSFRTGTSTVPGKERLVLQGMFAAGSFLLERDLKSVSANTTTAAELFLYTPRLLFTMPRSMLHVPITWEEVAP